MDDFIAHFEKKRKRLCCTVEHTGVFKWESVKNIEVCPLFNLAMTYEKEGRRFRWFLTNFSAN